MCVTVCVCMYMFCDSVLSCDGAGGVVTIMMTFVDRYVPPHLRGGSSGGRYQGGGGRGSYSGAPPPQGRFILFLSAIYDLDQKF